MTKNDYIDYTDKTISELVHEKWELLKAYNYYNCRRDPELYKYLEENYGIGTPTSVVFIPLIRKHIDALVGEYLGTPILPKVTCKDENTITKITREKLLKITEQVLNFLQNRLKNKIVESLTKDPTDPRIKAELDDLVEELEEDFLSDYEVAAQNVVDYLIQCRETNFLNNLRTLILDLLITGYTFYRAKATSTSVELEVLNPLNTFIDRNPNSPFVKDSYRVVIRKWMNKREILNLYGKDLSPEDRQSIKDEWEYSRDYSTTYVRSYQNADGTPATPGLRAGQEVTPGYPENTYFNYNLIPVYEVEWLDVDKDYTMLRYKTVRIGDDIYIIYGKDEKVVRSLSNPKYCTLSVNGIYFLNRNFEPYSMVLACADLLDKNDLLYFYRDSLIANSGTSGDWIDVSMLPKFLGENMTLRIQKFLAYKKSGQAFIDTSLEGRLSAGQAPINTIFNGYDDTIKSDAILAIQMAIDANELTCSSITGVFRERLNGIQQKDAVTNVQTSVNNSFIISKQWNQQMDTVVIEMLTDALNQAKIAFKHGLQGVLILGDKQVRTFTALPEYFTVSDYDIHIVNSSDINKDIVELKLIIPSLILGLLVDAELAIDLSTSKSLTYIKLKLRMAMRKLKKENSQLLQMSQQLELVSQEAKLLQQELQKAQAKIEQLNEAKLQIEKEKVAAETKVNMYKAKTERTYREAVIENDNKRTEIELLQLKDGNPYNDEVVNVRTK